MLTITIHMYIYMTSPIHFGDVPVDLVNPKLDLIHLSYSLLRSLRAIQGTIWNP